MRKFKILLALFAVAILSFLLSMLPEKDVTASLDETHQCPTTAEMTYVLKYTGNIKCCQIQKNAIPVPAPAIYTDKSQNVSKTRRNK